MSCTYRHLAHMGATLVGLPPNQIQDAMDATQHGATEASLPITDTAMATMAQHVRHHGDPAVLRAALRRLAAGVSALLEANPDHPQRVRMAALYEILTGQPPNGFAPAPAMVVETLGEHLETFPNPCPLPDHSFGRPEVLAAVRCEHQPEETIAWPSQNCESEYEAWIAREAQHMQRLVQRFEHAMRTPVTQQTEERLRTVTDDGVEVWDVVEQVLDSDGRPMVRWYWKRVRRHGEKVHVLTESAGRLLRFARPVPLMTFWGMPVVGQWKDVEVAAGTKIAEPNRDPATWQNYWAWYAAFDLVYSAS